MSNLYKIEARASGQLPSASPFVLYGRRWEVCEGTDGLLRSECDDLIRAWLRDDMRNVRESLGYGRKPHEYRVVESASSIDPDDCYVGVHPSNY